MSTEQVRNDEDLNKSIDALIEDVFADKETPAENVEKSEPVYSAKDSKTTADAAVSQAPKSEKDESRGAGRPKQISDVPQVDMDGRRDSEYDESISEDSKDKEPEEAKKQAKPMDQSIDAGRSSSKSPAPKSAPFRKSADGVEQDGVSLTKAEFEEYQAFKKAQEDKKEQDAKTEVLRKAQEAKKEQEDLVKSAINSATESLRKSMDDLKKTNEEQATLLKAMASQPVRAKSIVGIEQLEKSQSKEDKGPQSFTKSEILDAAAELVMKGKLNSLVVSEIEMTGRVSDPQARRVIEQALEGKS